MNMYWVYWSFSDHKFFVHHYSNLKKTVEQNTFSSFFLVLSIKSAVEYHFVFCLLSVQQYVFDLQFFYSTSYSFIQIQRLRVTCSLVWNFFCFILNHLCHLRHWQVKNSILKTKWYKNLSK